MMKALQSVFKIFSRTTVQQKQAPDSQINLAFTDRYFLAVIFLFAVQGFVALLGGLEMVTPDLSSPLPIEYGRAIHLALAVLWPLIGTMGMVYYFVSLDLNLPIFSPKLARWQFWLVFGSALAIYATLALKIGNGKEYLDGLPILYLGVGASLALANYNLLRTIVRAKQVSPAVVSMVSGLLFALIFLLPNAFNYNSPMVEESFRFWVVHLWEELAFELTTVGFVAAYFTATGLARRKDVERLLYIELTIAVGSGLFGTGHHFYWLGLPSFWLWLGSLFSLLQLIPTFMLAYLAYKILKRTGLSAVKNLGLWLILSSLFYHVTGAALFGCFIAIPWINLYIHGTFLTSSHAHFALFGSLGFLVLGASVHCLTVNTKPDKKADKMGKLAVLLLNIGLLVMGSALFMAGTIETYLWRVIGIGFLETIKTIRPFLIVRVFGGLLFTTGDILLCWTTFKLYRSKPKIQVESHKRRS